MGNVIKIKRGEGIPGKGVLEPYELGIDKDSNTLYYGGEDGHACAIAGGGGGGTGSPGATFTPAVSEEGVISWTNNGGLENPDPVDIKGPKGDTGAPGTDGKSAYKYAQDGGYTGTEAQFATKLATTYPKPSITDYPKLSGENDDTKRFQRALAENRVLYVPGGEYNLSDTLTIRQNCELELAQDVILDFQQVEGNCIELRSSSTLRGNHGILRVPPRFTGNVISSTTTNDTTRDTPPYLHWDPQWKRGRYIYDINIVKPEAGGLHYIGPNDTCTGNGIYLSCDGNSEVRFMWGVLMHGIRISGGFANGIRVINYDLPTGPEDNAWNHDMRIEAVIEFCETAVNLTNCNGPHLAVTVQPHCASDGVTPYAKWGVRLEDCKFVDMSSSVVWDWNEKNSLIGTDKQYASVAMYGECSGLILYDYAYYRSGTDIRERVYSDRATNLERMVVMQEPITRWFKTIDNTPYFYDGASNEELLLKKEFHESFETQLIPAFTNQLPLATDTDNTVFNGVGYKPNTRINFNTGLILDVNYYTATGFIPCSSDAIIYMSNVSFKDLDGWTGIYAYDNAYNPISGINAGAFSQDWTAGYLIYAHDDNNCSVTLKKPSKWSNMAYVRFSFEAKDILTNPVISVNEPIIYNQVGALAETIRVTDKNIESTKLNTLQTKVNNIAQNITDNVVEFNTQISELETRVNDKLNNLSITTKQADFILPGEGEDVVVPDFTNVVLPFQEGKWWNASKEFTDLEPNIYIEPKAFAYNDHITIRGIDFTKNYSVEGYGRIWRLWKDVDGHNMGDYGGVINIANLISSAASGTGGTSYPDIRYDWNASTSTLQIFLDQLNYTTKYLYAFGGPYATGYNAESIIMTVNEDIDYRTEYQGEPLRFIKDLYAQNVVLTSPNGTAFELKVGDDGTLTATQFVIEN